MARRTPRLVALTSLYCLVGATACTIYQQAATPPTSAAPKNSMTTEISAPPAATPAAAAKAKVDLHAAADAHFKAKVMPLINQYCVGCHNTDKPASDLALDKYKTFDQLIEDRDMWELVSKYVRTQQMPPDSATAQPTDSERHAMSSWIDGQLVAYYTAHPDPGRVIVRRLNKSEYNHTVRDLIGVDFQPADDFPQDDSGYGFDNVGDVLSLPPVLMEKYLAAADRILDQALPSAPPASKVRHVAASQAEIGFNALGDRGDGWVKLISLEEDDAALAMPLPAGDYLFRFKAFAEPTGGGLVGQGSSVPLKYEGVVPPTKLGVFVGSTFIKDVEIDATEKEPKVYEVRLGLPGGKARVSASVRRNRGTAADEVYMLNGRIGTQQPGIVYVKYLELEGPLPAAIQRTPAQKLTRTGEGKFMPDNGWMLQKNGEVSLTLDMPASGERVVRIEAASQQAGTEPVKMELRVNDQPVQTFDVIAPAALTPLPRQRLFDINLLNARPYVYEAKISAPAGKVKIAAAFVNDFEDPANTNPNLKDRNLIVNYIEVVDPSRPLPIAPKPETFAQYFKTKATPNTREAAREILAAFMRRAYRRTVQPAEVDRTMGLFDQMQADKEPFDASLKLSLKAVLVSPHFLFHGELSPTAAGAAAKGDPGMHPVDEFALASRLSYFLWSSTPDEELLTLAEKGQLRKNLDPQVKRMLASAKVSALVENFAGQWLQLRNMQNLAPDKGLFKDYDDGLRKAMERETELLFNNVVREDKSLIEILTADYSFMNARLARFYGIENPPTGEEFVKVSLANTNRRGILTQGSILTLTSNPTRTSPVKRGKFVLENLLGSPPPPPPPDVPKLEDAKGDAATGTLRHQMEAHRANPVCASCHAQMDPIGFGLENFDAIGKFRTQDGTAAVDAGGKLKTGEAFANPGELVNILVTTRRDDYLHCVTEKMMTYALGRGVESYDRPAVENIVAALNANDAKFSTLIIGITKSMPFQMQRDEVPTPTAAAPAVQSK